MQTYPVLTPIRAGKGKRYLSGTAIDLDQKAAAELLACKAIGPAVAAVEQKATRPSAKECIDQAAAAADLEALDQLSVGEDRSTVLAAIDKRRQELKELQDQQGQA